MSKRILPARSRPKIGEHTPSILGLMSISQPLTGFYAEQRWGAKEVIRGDVRVIDDYAGVRPQNVIDSIRPEALPRAKLDNDIIESLPRLPLNFLHTNPVVCVSRHFVRYASQGMPLQKSSYEMDEMDGIEDLKDPSYKEKRKIVRVHTLKRKTTIMELKPLEEKEGEEEEAVPLEEKEGEEEDTERVQKETEPLMQSPPKSKRMLPELNKTSVVVADWSDDDIEVVGEIGLEGAAQAKHVQANKNERYVDPMKSKAWQENKFEEGTYINADLRHFNLAVVGKYDAVMLDPPWRLRSGQERDIPAEGRMFENNSFSLQYQTMSDAEILDMDVGCLIDHGFCFLWVTNSQLPTGLQALERWGFKYIDRIVWVKKSERGNVAISFGYYFLHSTEICLVGVKSTGPGKLEYIPKVNNDVVFAPVRETSRKPDEIYRIIEQMIPGGRRIELFARNWNIRKGWMQIGNELGPWYDLGRDRIVCDECKQEITRGCVRFKIKHGPAKDVCEVCFGKRDPSKWFRLENSGDGVIFHPNYSCDHCGAGKGNGSSGTGLCGMRFSCTHCELDLCEACYDRWAMKPKDHVFQSVEQTEPGGGLPLHTSIRCGACRTKPIAGYRFSFVQESVDLCHRCFFLRKSVGEATFGDDMVMYTHLDLRRSSRQKRSGSILLQGGKKVSLLYSHCSIT